ncbi:PAS domain S-box protein [Dinoroseobacter sp. S375]|uniref:hybrid sensor histidine kinase/response regulator n=1 Tax=Dinoroseobacter sp. S375 TaxID=3415136 RepID=UPI003C7A14D6
MAEDERLREALLELQLLREREAKSLNETRKLLECLEAYSSARTPGDALGSIFVSLRNKIGADLAVLGEIDSDGSFLISASDEARMIGKRLVPPFDLGARARDIIDLSVTGAWGGDLDISGYTGFECAPLHSDGRRYALAVFKASPPAFARGSLSLVERLAGLALRALQGSKIATENKLLAAAIQGSSSGFAIADATRPERPLIYVNSAFEEISGYTAEEVLGENCRFLSAEPVDGAERSRLRAAVRDNAPGQFLLRNQRKDGSLFWNELTLFPVEDEAGRIVNLVATQNDVSGRVEAAAERDKTRAQMARALTATEDAFLVLEPGHVVAFSNDATRDIFFAPNVDWSVGSTFGENWAAYLMASDDLPGRVTTLLAEPDLEALSQLPNGREIDLPDGHTVLIRASSFADGGMVLSATDVTPMKSAQRLLSQRLAAIEAAQDGIAVTDVAGRLTFLNRAASELLGFASPTAALGKTWYTRYDSQTQSANQEPFDMTLERQEKGKTRTHEVTGTVLDSGGTVIVFRDITDRLEYETREADLKQGLRQLQRQEATAQLTAGIAHDFNNLLSAINGSATLIGLEEQLTDSLKAHVNRISTAGTQAAKLVNRLLDIGANNDAQGTFDLRSAIADIPALVEPSLPQGVSLSMAAGEGSYALSGDPGSLTQAIVNLVLNARDAIGSGDGQIALEVSSLSGRRIDGTHVGELLPARRYVRIDVSDTGSGIDPGQLEAVFEPYFSTKGRHGTGLGLAMVSLQVQAIGGAVGIRSVKGTGTTVSVYWPIASPEEAGQAGPAAAGHHLGGQTIILVDDDEDVATVAAAYLEAQGAEVAVCIDPRDAVEAVEDAPEAWSAVVTDYDMPEMNGGDLAERVKRANPDIPVILVTALARRLSDPRVTNGTVDMVLAKPTDLNHLSSVLSEYHGDPN